MKLLYVDVFCQSINPTANLAPILMDRVCGDVYYYGPGYSTALDLETGLLAYCEKHGPFDFLVLGPNLPVMNTRVNAVRDTILYLNMYTSLLGSPEIISSSIIDILGAISEVPATFKAIWLLNFDYYSVTDEQIELLDRLELVVLGPSHQFIAPISSLPEWASVERHFVRKSDKISDAFYNFLIKNVHRSIPLPHFVSDGELCFRSLASRRNLVSVPGVQYELRKRAIKTLRDGRYPMPTKIVFRMFQLAQRLRLKPFSSYLGLKVYHAAFQRVLFDTQFVFTARGGFGIPIRKFFEIPASGAVLLCVPPNGFCALGFTDGVTHIECDTSDLPDVIDDFCKNPSEAQFLANAGRSLIRGSHSLVARQSQLRIAMDAMLKRNYGGADWVDGRFVLREKV